MTICDGRLIAPRISIVHRKSGIVRHKNGYSTHYVLYAVAAANTQVKLWCGLDNSDTAVFIEQQPEHWPKIEDRPVAGEIPR
jgi:hypothetical protein